MFKETPDNALCLHCGYPLYGLPTRVCPECGTEFDPSDPQTYRDTSNPTRWYRPPRPTPRWLRTAILPVTILWLVDVSSPGAWAYWGVPFPSFLLAIVLFVAAYGSVRFGLGFLRMSIACALRQIPRSKMNTKGVALIVACVIVAFSYMILPWPMMLRFKLSQPALERAAVAQLADGKGTFESRWVGGYWIRGLFIPHRGTVMLRTGIDGTARVGFVYCRPGASLRNVSVMQSLSANWCVARWECGH